MRERKRDEEERIHRTRTVAATYVENRVTNHKRVYGGASDHWPQRIIDGYSRCRVSIRRTIEMKGCTRTVKAELVTIPRWTDERSGRAGIVVPLDTNQSSPSLRSLYRAIDPLPPMFHPHGTRFDCEALSVPTDLLYQLVTISLVFRFFYPLLHECALYRVSRTYRITFITDSKNRAESRRVRSTTEMSIFSLNYFTFG